MTLQNSVKWIGFFILIAYMIVNESERIELSKKNELLESKFQKIEKFMEKFIVSIDSFYLGYENHTHERHSNEKINP